MVDPPAAAVASPPVSGGSRSVPGSRDRMDRVIHVSASGDTRIDATGGAVGSVQQCAGHPVCTGESSLCRLDHSVTRCGESSNGEIDERHDDAANATHLWPTVAVTLVSRRWGADDEAAGQ